MAEHCAVIGIGQTKHRESRRDLSMPGLVRAAAIAALEDAEMGFSDIDAIVLGTAPDMFEGVMMPELFFSDALGASGKPIFRVHTAGSVGGSTAVVASHLVQAGVHDKVLTVAFEKQSESNAMWALSPAVPFQPQLVAGAGGYFAPLIRSYIRRADAHPDTGCMVAVKDREHGLLNPYAHLHLEQTLDDGSCQARAPPLRRHRDTPNLCAAGTDGHGRAGRSRHSGRPRQEAVGSENQADGDDPAADRADSGPAPGRAMR